ncbi:DUF1049 domain-containing protein [candidate division KSB1 bacterium]|nr:DUF1049 domain-containing protein [candidate division KSB1 bacterium]
MWIIKWIFIALVIIVLIGFAMQNTEQTVTIRFLSYQSIPLPLWVVMYISFAIGLLTWLLISIFQLVKSKAVIHKFKKENNRLKGELDRLRNVSVEETVIPGSDKGVSKETNSSDKE